MSNLTLVTGLFDIGRGNIGDGFKRDFTHYIECFKRLLRAATHIPMVVYVSSEHEGVVWECRNPANTKVVIKTAEDLRRFPFYEEVQTLRVREEWYGQSGWLVDSPQAKLELYNPLVMSKQFLLNDATLYNFFDTKYFAWIDGGITNTVSIEGYLNDEHFERKLTKKMDKMLYLCFPYDGTVEVHGFKKSMMDSYAGKKTEYVARGGFFGGSKEVINQINDLYYGLLASTLSAGYMGTEESIFTLLTYRNPELCNVHMIEPNGLVYKFFEDLKNDSVPSVDSELAIYALTFNIPKQFELFAESLKKACPKEFKNASKYVINNSNDPSVDVEYKNLFHKYGFTEFKFDNIGINGGRHFSAEHFDKSGHEFMVFFEDDMLLHEDRAVRCRNGFSTYQPDLFDKVIDIIKSEDLDYLKLSFTEFYGDNHDNWAWYNVPSNVRQEHFPSRRDGVSEKKTKIDYTGSKRGLPYAVGEFHYCNWPIVFTKRGNRRVFLDVVYEHKYEQTWMSLTFQRMRKGELKVGALLASPINHHRAFHYESGTRRENEMYKN